MKKIVSLSLLALSLVSFSAFAEQFQAFISDSKCAAKHAADGNAKCVQNCVKNGQSAVAVVGEHVYKITPDTASKVADHLGQKVTITGTLNGDTLTISSVSGS